ncbi:hypothetical protein GcM3_022028 [Golovinomyces cichoracearum]|uniref:Uncharacterized protein n=1 Tax=Golovinomyces cichoracearum TaxID=62708 RepID=A0A420J7D2_9PEZI|nr:hypothetical protein GcM3_022028 [Golovinomyces cichoracearum]
MLKFVISDPSLGHSQPTPRRSVLRQDPDHWTAPHGAGSLKYRRPW